MKFQFLLILVFVSSTSYGSELIGKWSVCETTKNGRHSEYLVEFNEDGSEIEYTILHEEASIPCTGKRITGVLNVWSFKAVGNHFQSELYSATVVAETKDQTSIFSKIKMCGTSSWQEGKFVNCTNHYLFGDLYSRGLITRHSFVVKGDELHVTDDEGDVFILNKTVGLK